MIACFSLSPLFFLLSSSTLLPVVLAVLTKELMQEDASLRELHDKAEATSEEAEISHMRKRLLQAINHEDMEV